MTTSEPKLLLRCFSCDELSTRPGQFLDPDTWVCSEACRKDAFDKQAYADLAASGGIQPTAFDTLEPAAEQFIADCRLDKIDGMTIIKTIKER